MGNLQGSGKIVDDCLTVKNLWEVTWRVSDCEELVGEVNHTTESVTDLFGFVDFEWGFV